MIAASSNPAMAISVDGGRVDELVKHASFVLDVRILSIDGRCRKSHCSSRYGATVLSDHQNNDPNRTGAELSICAFDDLRLGRTYTIFTVEPVADIEGSTQCDATILPGSAFLRAGDRAFRVSSSASIPFKTSEDQLVIGYATLYRKFAEELRNAISYREGTR